MCICVLLCVHVICLHFCVCICLCVCVHATVLLCLCCCVYYGCVCICVLGVCFSVCVCVHARACLLHSGDWRTEVVTQEKTAYGQGMNKGGPAQGPCPLGQKLHAGSVSPVWGVHSLGSFPAPWPPPLPAGLTEARVCVHLTGSMLAAFSSPAHSHRLPLPGLHCTASRGVPPSPVPVLCE